MPSDIVLMPEWPCIGWPLNGSDTPVARSKDLPITEPSASTRLPVVYLPEVLQIGRRIRRRVDEGLGRQHGMAGEDGRKLLGRRLLLGEGRCD